MSITYDDNLVGTEWAYYRNLVITDETIRIIEAARVDPDGGDPEVAV